jgi:uncharacterized protein YndB with AHSA1/START domain
MTDGTLVTSDGRAALRFERTLPHSVERVWRAVSTPAELERWFPAAVDWTPAEGETLKGYGATGEVTEVDAPHRLAWTFGGEHYRFELSAQEGGCRLIFTHIFGVRAMAAQVATGWHTYLSRLEAHLAGRHLSEQEANKPWKELHERYAERFGVDPTPGRLFAETLGADDGEA